jgi:hypothetical protein
MLPHGVDRLRTVVVRSAAQNVQQDPFNNQDKLKKWRHEKKGRTDKNKLDRSQPLVDTGKWKLQMRLCRD